MRAECWQRLRPQWLRGRQGRLLARRKRLAAITRTTMRAIVT